MTKQPKPFRNYLARALGRGMLFLGITIMLFGYANHASNVAKSDPVERPLAVGSPAELQTHFSECWSSGDKGLPDAVIYRPVEGGDWAVGGKHIAGKVLDEMFDKKPDTLVFYSFCR